MRGSGLATCILLPAAVGCAGNATGSADAEVATTTGAVVVVERTNAANEGSRAEASARFVRIAAGASVDDALSAIGASLELPARGACASVTSLGGAIARGEPAPVVELVDVGAVSIEAGGVETHLLPRQLPDVTDVVSGVVYARAAEPTLLPAATRYAVHVAGGQDLGAFDVTASAPGDPSAVRIAGEDRQGNLVAAGPTVDLAWPTDASDDVVYVDVRPNGVRCVFGNTGQAAVSTLFFDETGTLVVHRLHREPLRAAGIDSGEVRFDFARSVAYTRQ
jgi:hypothetical protein